MQSSLLDKLTIWEIAHLKEFNFIGGISIIPELTTLLFGLSIYTATFIAEVVRAGILEVAHALGLKSGQTLRLVIIP